MDLTNQLLDKLNDKYNVEYDEKNKFWRRTISGKVRVQNIKDVMTIITGEEPTVSNTFVDYKNNIVKGGRVCICGCGHCHNLYKLFDKKTHTCFLLGSDCINLTHLNYSNDLKCGEKNGYCEECGIPLRLNGDRKNYNKKRCDDTCNHCYDAKQLVIRQQKMQRDKQREIQKLEESRIHYEKIMQEHEEQLNRIQTIFLNISFEDKDKYKSLYRTRWNPDKKLWHWTGDINDFPPELIPLKRV